MAKLSNAAHCSGAATEQPAAENGAADMAASCSRFQQQQQWEIKSSGAAEQLNEQPAAEGAVPSSSKSVQNKVCIVIIKI